MNKKTSSNERVVRRLQNMRKQEFFACSAKKKDEFDLFMCSAKKKDNLFSVETEGKDNSSGGYYMCL